MIFIMPGSSAVGALTIDALLDLGVAAETIRAGVRSPEKAALKVPVVRADYTDPASLRATFEGVKTLALIPTKSPPGQRCVEHENAIAAAAAAGVERVVFLSIVTHSPESVAAIAPFILFAESATRTSGMDWAIVRMGLYLEPVADWVPELVKMGRLPYPVRQGKAAYVTREDVARTFAAVCANPALKGEIYNATADPVTMPELAAAIGAAIGEEIPFEACSQDEFIELCNMSGEPPFITRVLLSLYRAIEMGEMNAFTSDVERVTGRPAETPAHYFQRVLAP